MHKDITVKIGDGQNRIFLQNGFYNKLFISDKLHSHGYAEIHLVLGGSLLYRIGEEELTLGDGDMLIIPRGLWHSGRMLSPDTRQAAFQTDLLGECVEKPSVIHVGSGILRELFSEIDLARESRDYRRISAFAGLLISYLPEAEPIEPERITDCGFLIHEFFANRYAEDVSLGDLALDLHLSERQAERMVLKYTGRSFREQLCHARVSAAKRLLGNTTMTLSEIASYVGYKSYAGFWKAMKKEQIM